MVQTADGVGSHCGAKANKRYIDSLRIRRIASASAPSTVLNSTAAQLHDAIVASVERIMGLHARLAPIRDVPTSERDDLRREVDRVDSEIDGLVYELYGLTEAERRLVEGDTP